MTWEVVKIIGNLFNDTSKNSRNKRTSSSSSASTSTISDFTSSTSKNRQQKSSSLIAKSQKIPSSPIIHPVPLLRTPSSSSITTHTTPSSNFVFENDDITQQLAEESELLYLQLPEDVKSILDKLRILQRSEKSLTFDQQLPNGEWQVVIQLFSQVRLIT